MYNPMFAQMMRGRLGLGGDGVPQSSSSPAGSLGGMVGPRPFQQMPVGGQQSPLGIFHPPMGGQSPTVTPGPQQEMPLGGHPGLVPMGGPYPWNHGGGMAAPAGSYIPTESPIGANGPMPAGEPGQYGNPMPIPHPPEPGQYGNPMPVPVGGPQHRLMPQQGGPRQYGMMPWWKY